MMKKIVTFFLPLFLLSNLAFSQQQLLSVENNRIIVQLGPTVGVEVFVEKMNAQIPGLSGLQWAKPLAPRLNIHLLSFEKYEGEKPLHTLLAQQPGVLSATLDQPVEFRNTTPNDPLHNQQWHMHRISLPDVWGISTGGLTANGDQIVVAVLEKGFEHAHEDLVENIWENPGEIPWDGIDNDSNGWIDDVHGWNFRNETPFFSIERHGTNVLGIIGGRGDNGLGISGVNWDVKMMLLGVYYDNEVISAFNYIVEMRELYHSTNGQKGAFIVATNASFGRDAVSCAADAPWNVMYDLLGEAGVLSVAATTNENFDVDEVGDMPTSCPSDYLLSVTSTDTSDTKVTNAGFGKTTIDLAAPGRHTITTDPFDEYYFSFGGNSAACPHVSGAIGLLYSMPCTGLADLAREQPSAAARLVRDAILKNTDLLPSLRDKTVTGGRMNVFKSMQYLHAWCIARVDERAEGSFKEIYLEKKNFVRLFPNPVSETLTVEFSNEGFGEVSVTVFNVLGQQMSIPNSATNKPFEVQQLQIDVSDWGSGTYFVKLLGTDEKIVRKFVKI